MVNPRDIAGERKKKKTNPKQTSRLLRKLLDALVLIPGGGTAVKMYRYG